MARQGLPRTAVVADGPAGVVRPRSHRALLDAFSAQLAAHDPTGALLARSDDLESLARSAADGVLDASAVWQEHLGSFYDSEAVRSLLSRDGRLVSRQAVHQRPGLLALRTGSGQVVYPAMQFRGRQPAPGLGLVLGALPESLVSRWTVASWLNSCDAELGDRPVAVLHDGGPEGVTAVLAAAVRWAGALGATG